MNKVIFIDLNRCIYCRSCEVACEREHGGHSFMSVALLDESGAVPMNCRHCMEPVCMYPCLTGAISKDPNNGMVQIDADKCMGCWTCVVACPFGIPQRNLLSKVAEKCDLCIHRLNEGKSPACVTTCPARALVFDEFEAISEKIKQWHLLLLRVAVRASSQAFTTTEKLGNAQD